MLRSKVRRNPVQPGSSRGGTKAIKRGLPPYLALLTLAGWAGTLLSESDVYYARTTLKPRRDPVHRIGRSRPAHRRTRYPNPTAADATNPCRASTKREPPASLRTDS